MPPTSMPEATALPNPNIPGLGKLPEGFEAARITQVEDFYVQNSNGTASVDSFEWRLNLTGMFDTPLELNLFDIKRRPKFDVMRTLECIGNPVGGSLIGNAVWQGISLHDLLREAGIQEEAKFLSIFSADEYRTTIPVSLGLDENSYVVYAMNGEDLDADHGRPVRMLLPGVYGQKQPKWVLSIHASDKDSLGTWEKKGWSNEAVIQVNSKLETPRIRQMLPAGVDFYLTGLAMADFSGVVSVDVSIDDGESWQPAELLSGPDTGVWALWSWVWENPQPGKYALLARATDGNGVAQTASGSFGVLDNVFPNGTSLMHKVTVTVA